MDPGMQPGMIPYSKGGEKAADEKLLLPFQYITQVPGKNIRAKLSRAFNYWLQIPEDKMQIIDNIVEILHNASLLIDDIEDSSILRRGIPVAHSIYGVASTINAANYAMIIALERCLDLHHPEATKVCTEQLLDLHRGQGLEIYWRDNFVCPTEEEYIEMTTKKTGGLFMLAIRLMQLFSENKSDFAKIAAILGVYFQVHDDYINLHSTEYQQNKSYCEDLTEGKFGFPLIHAIHTYPNDTRIMKILRQRTKDNELKKYCVTLLEHFGSFEYTRKKLCQLTEDAQKEMEKLGENPFMQKVIDSIFTIRESS